MKNRIVTSLTGLAYKINFNHHHTFINNNSSLNNCSNILSLSCRLLTTTQFTATAAAAAAAASSHVVVSSPTTPSLIPSLTSTTTTISTPIRHFNVSSNSAPLSPSPLSSFFKRLSNTNNKNNNNNNNNFNHSLSLLEAFRQTAKSLVAPLPIPVPIITPPTQSSSNTVSIRRANSSDISDILNLLSGPMSRGAILPISLETLTRTISDYVVCHIDGQLAGSACLKHFPGEIAELTKICTSPAFQGRGIASHLVRQLVDLADFKSKNYVFALTTEPAMARVFSKLGFENVDRDLLCKEWRQNYDMSRPSKAYYLPVKNDSLSPVPVNELSYFSSTLATFSKLRGSTSITVSGSPQEPVVEWAF